MLGPDLVVVGLPAPVEGEPPVAVPLVQALVVGATGVVVGAAEPVGVMGGDNTAGRGGIATGGNLAHGVTGRVGALEAGGTDADVL